nr:MAG TPA: hypothetical protein [Caudoviricetes sp.]
MIVATSSTVYTISSGSLFIVAIFISLLLSLIYFLLGSWHNAIMVMQIIAVIAIAV